jgi:5-methylthioadenosine/S-adenosylhomocysteine deaminase
MSSWKECEQRFNSRRVVATDTAGTAEEEAMADRILLRGGYVLTVDTQLGDIPGGDVLIEGDKIAEVGRDISADAEVIEVTGDIVIPGFVDTHRHTWETAIRSCAPNATLDDYFVEVLDSFAPLYRPDEVYVSNLAGALECINAGITTLVDWSHINNTPDHPDAGIQGLKEAGIRAVYAYGSANTSLADYWFNSKITIPRDDVERIHNTYFSSDDGLLTMALATRGPGFCQDFVVREEWGMARDLGIPITTHFAMGKLAGKWSMVTQLEGLGLLGPDTTYIHCCYFSEEEWKLVADSSGTISVAPQVEMQMGHGWPPIMKAREYGLRPSLSADVVTTVPGDMFSEMRCAFAAERWKINDSVWESEEPVPDTMLTARDMLTMATLDGAHVAGLEDRTGSLTPGKQADVVVIDGSGQGIAPIIDPVASVVLCADTSNVDTVIIDGKIRKRDGKLLANWDPARKRLQESSDYLVEAREKRQQEQQEQQTEPVQ